MLGRELFLWSLLQCPALPALIFFSAATGTLVSAAGLALARGSLGLRDLSVLGDGRAGRDEDDDIGLLAALVREVGRALTTGELTCGRDRRDELSIDLRRCSFRSLTIGLVGGEEQG